MADLKKLLAELEEALPELQEMIGGEPMGDEGLPPMEEEMPFPPEGEEEMPLPEEEDEEMDLMAPPKPKKKPAFPF